MGYTKWEQYRITNRRAGTSRRRTRHDWWRLADKGRSRKKFQSYKVHSEAISRMKKEKYIYDVLLRKFPGSKNMSYSGPFKGRGVADVALNVDGITVWAECKIDNGKTTPIQDNFLMLWRYAVVIRYKNKTGLFEVENRGRWRPSGIGFVDELAPVTAAKIERRLNATR